MVDWVQPHCVLGARARTGAVLGSITPGVKERRGGAPGHRRGEATPMPASVGESQTCAIRRLRRWRCLDRRAEGEGEAQRSPYLWRPGRVARRRRSVCSPQSPLLSRLQRIRGADEPVGLHHRQRNIERHAGIAEASGDRPRPEACVPIGDPLRSPFGLRYDIQF